MDYIEGRTYPAAGGPFVYWKPTETEIRIARDEGKKIVAIKMLLERTGAKLADAKCSIETIPGCEAPIRHAVPPQTSPMDRQAIALERLAAAAERIAAVLERPAQPRARSRRK